MLNKIKKSYQYFSYISIVIVIAMTVIYFFTFIYNSYVKENDFIKNSGYSFQIKNIGVIMGGNKKWSKSQEYNNQNPYKEGAKRFFELIKLGLDEKLDTIVIFGLSINNIRQKSKKDLDAIYNIAKTYLDDRLDWLKKNGVKIKFIGNRDLFSPNIQSLVCDIEKITEKGKNLNLFILFGYDPFEDFRYAFKKISRDKKNDNQIDALDRDDLLTYFQSSDIPHLDLIIRTGGHEKLSGFLPVQAMYSEIVFLPYMWPSVAMKDIKYLMDLFSFRMSSIRK